jgi:hypothetical protein
MDGRCIGACIHAARRPGVRFSKTVRTAVAFSRLDNEQRTHHPQRAEGGRNTNIFSVPICNHVLFCKLRVGGSHHASYSCGLSMLTTVGVDAHAYVMRRRSPK